MCCYKHNYLPKLGFHDEKLTLEIILKYTAQTTPFIFVSRLHNLISSMTGAKFTIFYRNRRGELGRGARGRWKLWFAA